MNRLKVLTMTPKQRTVYRGAAAIGAASGADFVSRFMITRAIYGLAHADPCTGEVWSPKEWEQHLSEENPDE